MESTTRVLNLFSVFIRNDFIFSALVLIDFIAEYIQLQCIFAFVLWIGLFKAATVSPARPEDVQKLP